MGSTRQNSRQDWKRLEPRKSSSHLRDTQNRTTRKITSVSLRIIPVVLMVTRSMPVIILHVTGTRPSVSHRPIPMPFDSTPRITVVHVLAVTSNKTNVRLHCNLRYILERS